MDKLLKPKDLDVLPNDSNAASVFKYWIAKLESFLQAVEIGQAANDPSMRVNRRGLLVNFLTPSVYQYIEDCETYEAAVAELKQVYVKTKNDVFARHLLVTRRQLPGESLQQFLQVLKTLSKDCTFRAVSAEQYRGELIRDTFINGLASAAVRQRLLVKDDFTLKAAFEQAYSLKRAQQQSSSYSKIVAASSVLLQRQRSANSLAVADTESAHDLVSESPPYGLAVTVEKKRCYFCGRPYHKRSRCPAWEEICHKCQKEGHYARVCMSKEKTLSSNVAALPESFLASVVGAPTSLQAAVINVQVDKLPARALLDTGATESYIHEQLLKELKPKSQGELSRISLASVGSSVQVHGFVLVLVKAFSHWYELKMGVVQELCADLILGQDFLKKHKLATFLMGGPSKATEVNQCNTCGVAAADIQPPRLFQFLNPKNRPKATPSRRFNLVDMQFIREEVEKLLAQGIIEPSWSPWRAQVLVTKDERHKRRMVIDYSQTIHRFTELYAYPLPRIDQQVNELAKCKWFSTLDLKSAIKCP